MSSTHGYMYDMFILCQLTCFVQVLIANVWPEAAHTEETISTLRFASRVRLIETAPHVSECYDPSLMLKRWV